MVRKDFDGAAWIPTKEMVVAFIATLLQEILSVIHFTVNSS